MRSATPPGTPPGWRPGNSIAADRGVPPDRGARDPGGREERRVPPAEYGPGRFKQPDETPAPRPPVVKGFSRLGARQHGNRSRDETGTEGVRGGGR